MEREIDIYNYDRRLDSAIKKLDAAPISEQNKDSIMKFSNNCFANGIGKARVLKYVRMLRQLAQWLNKNFDTAVKEDIEKVVTTIHRRDDYAEWTKKDYNVVLKKFYKWQNNGEYPETVKWLRTRPNKNKIKLPGQDGLLTEEDIQKLLRACDHPRNKALIALLYESGCRIGEIANLKLNNLAIDDKGAVLTVIGKTGSRRIRIVSSVPHLLSWINNHPHKNDRKAPLWVNIGAVNHRKHVRYGTIRSTLEKIFKKAGINKRFNPHLFRHSRATFLANYLTEAQLKVYFGWVQGSDVAGTYIHLSGRDTDQKILEINGMAKQEDKKEQKLKPKICPRCSTINAQDSNYCTKCASILDHETAIQEQNKLMKQERVNQVGNELMDELIKDQEVREILIRKIKEYKLENKLKNI